MESSKLITLAIHTYKVAADLRHLLQQNGIEAVLQNVDLKNPDVFSGVRVRIKACDLPKALRLVETEPDKQLAATEMKLAGMSGTVLIPVDFSQNAHLAVKVGFDIANRLQMNPVLLHAFVTPYFRGSWPTANADNDLENLEDAGMEVQLDKQAQRQMDELKRHIDSRILAAELPPLKYATEIREGIPEEVILQYCRQASPSLVVMATRGIHRRSEELVGSVTAEVLDSCRVPLFVVPENYDLPPIREIDKVVFFCNLDQQDILSMDIFQRLFDYPNPSILLIPVNERAGSAAQQRVHTLETYFVHNYPHSSFHSVALSPTDFRHDFEQILQQYGLQLIVVPNKKRNIFSRLFNPSIAHRLLFEKDIPMLVLPS